MQSLILAPSRELAIQIEQVARSMGSGYKVNVVYGGRPIAKDFEELATLPALLVGTPGRLADHLRRGTFNPDTVRLIVLDEFDKSLEIGFEDDMKDILENLPGLEKRILTSATEGMRLPRFVGMTNPLYVNKLSSGIKKLDIKAIISPDKDKLETLYKALCHLGEQTGIVFLNFKDAIQRVSDYLKEQGIPHGTFHGSMEQRDRERALIKFRNGTHRLLLATDLAARGIDVQEINFIIHYHLPLKKEEFTHRNGRTARMHKEGTAYVMKWNQESLPDFMPQLRKASIKEAPKPEPTGKSTLFISGGRKDKISKGDIAGWFFKQGELEKNELGIIELKNDCAFVAVPKKKAFQLVKKLDNSRLKKRKVRVKLI